MVDGDKDEKNTQKVRISPCERDFWVRKSLLDRIRSKKEQIINYLVHWINSAMIEVHILNNTTWRWRCVPSNSRIRSIWGIIWVIESVPGYSPSIESGRINWELWFMNLFLAFVHIVKRWLVKYGWFPANSEEFIPNGENILTQDPF
jgi:hypothetical protein